MFNICTYYFGAGFSVIGESIVSFLVANQDDPGGVMKFGTFTFLMKSK